MESGTPQNGREVVVKRSRRRTRTVSAVLRGGVIEVSIPDRMSKQEEETWVGRMVGRIERQEKRRRPGDAELGRRAKGLADTYLSGLVAPSSVRWVSNQNARWGSCRPSDGSIRISDRLQGVPGWVLDYVLVHELAHLLEPNHGERFWRLVGEYPRTERARGYLEGLLAASGLQLGPGDDVPDVESEGSDVVGGEQS